MYSLERVGEKESAEKKKEGKPFASSLLWKDTAEEDNKKIINTLETLHTHTDSGLHHS